MKLLTLKQSKMIDQLIQQGKEMLGTELMQKAGLSETQLGSALDVTKSSVFDGLKTAALGGQLTDLMSMFNGQSPVDQTNPIVANIIGNSVSGLIQHTGIDATQAGTVAQTLVPFVMSKLGNKETGVAENEGALLNMLGMDKDNEIMEKLSQYFPGADKLMDKAKDFGKDLGKKLGGLFD